MQYEILKRENKYIWEIYSRYGSPLRKILASGETNTKEEAEYEVQEKMKTIKD